MAEEAVNVGVLRDALNSLELAFEEDEDGDFAIEYEPDESMGFGPSFLVGIYGEAKDVLIVGTQGREVAKEHWAHALMACNEWNRANCWPKFTFEPDDDDANTGRIHMTLDLLLVDGLTSHQVASYVDLALTTSLDGYRWLHQEKGL